ncbi:hypothetical protein N018_08140 [Pseudomonas syringae CC1557]|uniref:Uncharacterized protein n=1 Tax=Pseudomonas syringae CC1557 TaxID=1357279 RepID=W0MYM2_PSESX|nr:hypothetical protein N018_08140 [Pseudomonas syringae CC1557]
MAVTDEVCDVGQIITVDQVVRAHLRSFFGVARGLA